MPRTSQCKHCGIILNLPAAVRAGKRLRCPKCGLKFVVTESDASSESTLGGPLDADLTVTGFEIEKPRLGRDDLPLPMGDRDLRETFDLPLVSAREAEREGASAAPTLGDAAALFQEQAPTRRRVTAADARARARRCSNCGGVVPQGMSICASCGVDQETGLRVGLEDDLEPAAPPPPSGPPLHVAIVGGLLGTGALILLILSLIYSVGGSAGWENYGWLCLAIVSGFGIFAVVQFVRLKTAKLLMVALTLGAIINVMTLIAMPLVLAYAMTGDNISVSHSDDPDDSGVLIKSPELNTRHVSVGITFLVMYAVLSIYLMSPAVRKPLHRANASPF